MKRSSCLLFSFLFCFLTQNLIGKYLLVKLQDARDNEKTQVENESPESNNPRVDIKGFRSLQDACKDKIATEKCEKRKSKGKCNERWNQKNCQMTCGLCDDSEPIEVTEANSCEVPLDIFRGQPCIGYECPPTCDTTVQKLCRGKWHVNANGQLCPKSDHCIDRMVDNNGNRCPGHCLPDCREGQRIELQNGVDGSGCPLPAKCS